MTPLVKQYDGRILMIDEQAHEVLGPIHGRPAVSLRAPDGIQHEISVQDFQFQVSIGNVLDPETDGLRNRLPNAEEQFEVAFRKAVIEQTVALEAEGVTWPQRLLIMRERFERDAKFSKRQKKFPSERTIQVWMKQNLRHGVHGLRDRTFESGNRSSRHDALFEEILYDILEKHYLSSDRITETLVGKLAAAQYREKCRTEGIKPNPHGPKVVRRLIELLPHYDVVKRRLGSKEARRNMLQAGKIQLVESPLERVEIDCTTADVFCVIDDAGNVARPTICAAVDCATGLIVGLQVSLSSPHSLLVANTLKEIMSPHEERFFKKHKIEKRFQAIGRPLAVVADQGSENSGDLIERAIKTTSFELRKNVPGNPDRKPFVERLFRSINEVLTTLPGATQSKEIAAKSRTKRAMEEARLTFEDVESFLQKWRFDVHAHRSQRRIQSALRTREAPWACWTRLQEDHLVPEPPTPMELKEMFFAGAATRKLHRYGIEFEGIQFSSTELRKLFKEIGSNQVLEIRYDPTSILEIAVQNPLSGEYFIVGAKHTELPAISFDELRRLRKKHNPDVGEDLKVLDILDGMLEQHHKKPVRNPGTKHRQAKRATVNRLADQAAVDDARAKEQAARMVAEQEAAPKRLRRPANLPETSKRPE